MTAVCPVCDRPQNEGLMCHACTSTLEYELGDVPAIVAELDVTLSRQARIGGGGKGGLASEKNPMHVGAMNVAADLGNTLTTWARDVAQVDAGHWWGSADDPTKVAALLLLNHIPDIRRHPAADELHDEITDAVRQARRVVDRPAELQFVGPCLAIYPDDEGRDVTCTEDLYARPNAAEARCKVCSTEHPVAERRAWLLQQAADRVVTVREASQYVGSVGHITVTEASIRGYIHRGKLGYRPLGQAKGIRLGDLLAVVLDEGERKGAA